MRLSPVDVRHDILPMRNKQDILTRRRVPRIVELLRDEQTWSMSRIMFFGRILIECLNRRTHKKNCIWIHGRSNAGKTQLMGSFVKGFLDGMYGVPTNSQRTSFTFGNCASKRVIFWEEPEINNLNLETVKSIFGGGETSIDVKYRDNVILEPTPVIVTSNKTAKHGLTEEAALAIGNRVFQFNMFKAVQRDDLFPLTVTDWREFYFYLAAVKENLILDGPLEEDEEEVIDLTGEELEEVKEVEVKLENEEKESYST